VDILSILLDASVPSSPRRAGARRPEPRYAVAYKRGVGRGSRSRGVWPVWVCACCVGVRASASAHQLGISIFGRLVDNPHPQRNLKAVTGRGVRLSFGQPHRHAHRDGPPAPRGNQNLRNLARPCRTPVHQRNDIEGTFSVLAMCLNMHALPGFVRRLPRVSRWNTAKIILYHAKFLAQEQAGVAAAA
jgi:hypothetical protein